MSGTILPAGRTIRGHCDGRNEKQWLPETVGTVGWREVILGVELTEHRNVETYRSSASGGEMSSL